MKIQEIKQRFGIIGTNDVLDRAIFKAMQVAPTDISVLVTGESGVGKEAIPKIIHHLSHRKHAPLVAVNCGAIPEGTIDSELFGHEKGSFTGATGARKGYFEEADNGTIFMDEVGELPMGTQVRLLRVLENGEIIRVGSSKAQKVNVRVVGATNADMLRGIEKNQFREDLFYRLNTVEINLPPLRDRKGDIHLLFRKFAQDFAQKYRVPGVRLSDEAIRVLEAYRWPGNIRQLRNLVEQLCVIENDKEIDAEVLKNYIPEIDRSNLPARMETPVSKGEFKTEREILYKVLFDMRSDISNLKSAVQSIIKGGPLNDNTDEHSIIPHEDLSNMEPISRSLGKNHEEISQETLDLEPSEASNSNLSLQDLEIEMIKRAIERHRGRRKEAAEELGISERTLYRKIKQYDLG
ncbi:MAG: sigma-54-dependent Fis family transcriptional regulator [Owenweeksia sp. TMED14]|nr:MAG: sigma-54-dependent Fis family transcriptional regulator [Owenweeksia sp. TMED14]|tara:strand:- start:39083 stop:40303 length:1221 start_codon:yes stop_codon:yes gene_type:complete